MRCYLGIGSNLGDRRKNIEEAIKKLRQIKKIAVKNVSSLIETEPVGGPPQGKFLNGAIEIETKLKPHQLLKMLKEIEKQLGRRRTLKDGPRTIDLDILTYGKEKIFTKKLEVPHPRMWQRDFVLRPLREIAPELIKGLKRKKA